MHANVLQHKLAPGAVQCISAASSRSQRYFGRRLLVQNKKQLTQQRSRLQTNGTGTGVRWQESGAPGVRKDLDAIVILAGLLPFL